MKRVGKILLTILAAILLGALGSGLWERCISKLFDRAVYAITHVMSVCVCSYRDSIYSLAARGTYDRSSFVLLFMIILSVAGMYVYLLVHHPFIKAIREQSPLVAFWRFVSSQCGFYTLATIIMAVMLAFGVIYSRVMYIDNVVTYSLRSIEILSPHLDDSEIKSLRAQFHSVGDATAFYDFHERLLDLSSDKGVRLPIFDPL